MQKEIKIFKDYEKCVLDNLEFFQNFYYHSILDLNLVKLAIILEQGLITRNKIIK